MSKGPADEALIAAGEKMEKSRYKYTDKVMGEFCNNRDAGIDLLEYRGNKYRK